MAEERWQVSGSAAEIYRRQLVPAIFGPWAPRVLDLAALADLLDRHIGPAAGAIMRAPFALHDAEALGDLLAGGGFEDVEVRPPLTSITLNI